MQNREHKYIHAESASITCKKRQQCEFELRQTDEESMCYTNQQGQDALAMEAFFSCQLKREGSFAKCLVHGCNALFLRSLPQFKMAQGTYEHLLFNSHHHMQEGRLIMWHVEDKGSMHMYKGE